MNISQLQQVLKPLSWSYTQAKRIYLPVSIFSRNSQIEGNLISFAYAGNNSITKNYWARQVMGPNWEERSIGNHFSYTIQNYIENEHPVCSMILLQPGAFLAHQLEKQPVFKIPEWIDMEIDISPSIDELCKLSRSGFKDTRRLIKKYGLTFEVTHDLSHFDDFYYNMLIPYVNNRYEDTARIGSYSHEKDFFSRSDLFLIKKGDDVVGGSLVEYRDGGIFFRKMAVRNGNYEYVKQGVLGAAYYFTIDEMKRKGYQKIHIGGSRPVLSDGVTRFKTRWLGAIVPDYDPFDYTFMILLKNTLGLQDFLINNPFIHYTKNLEPISTVWTQYSTIDDFHSLLRSSHCAGIKGCQVFTFGQDTIPNDWIDPTIRPQPSIEPAESLFQK